MKTAFRALIVSAALALLILVFIQVSGCDDSRKTYNSTTVVECCDSCADLTFANCVLQKQVAVQSKAIVCFNQWLLDNERKLKKHHIKPPECPVGEVNLGVCEEGNDG